MSALLCALAICLFSNSVLMRFDNPILLFVQRMLMGFSDSRMQWAIYFVFAVYFLFFIRLSLRQTNKIFWRMTSPDLWLTGMFLIMAVSYVLSYPASAAPPDALIVLVSVVIGRGAAVWVAWRYKRYKDVAAYFFFGSAFMLLFIIATLWPENYIGRGIQYHDRTRWSGPWENPNEYGVLMGVGLINSIGGGMCGFACFAYKQIRPKSLKSIDFQWPIRGLSLAIACLLGYACFHSYSRGAWIGTAVALMYLFFNSRTIPGGSKFRDWLKRNRVAICIGIISLIVLSFWQFRQTNRLGARRVFSIANRNDFSWRNRVTAWEGALQMMGEKPWFGFGWGRPEKTYEHFYLPVRLSEGAAVETNDYLMLGVTLGVLPVFCFGMYIWLGILGAEASHLPDGPLASLRHTPGLSSFSPSRLAPEPDLVNPTARIFSRSVTNVDWMRVVYRSGAIVLVVGFCFDGGMFKASSAFTFWILSELGRPS
jgi:O-antigen ligase